MTVPELSLNEQEQVRRDKLARITADGREAYPVGYPRTSSYSSVGEVGASLGPDTITDTEVGVVGRVVGKRGQGKIAFAALQEGGEQLQVVLQLDRVGQLLLNRWFEDVDYGDHVGVTGVIGTTRRGELSVFVTSWAMTAKALRPLPDKHKGLADLEARARQRYVDLIVRPQARAALEARSAITWSIRESLHRRGYVEVETPVLQPLHGGAAARPFSTHMNALDIDLYLRISLELYLKRLVVGGVDKVFELAKNFRNEGVDTTHNPEFTMLEAYEAYGDYNTMAVQNREWIIEAARANGSTVISLPSGDSVRDVELDSPWRTETLHGLVSTALNDEIDPGTSIEVLRRHAALRSVALKDGWGAGEIVVELFEQLVEDSLIEPTFVRDYPVSMRPLTRAHREDPRLTECWDLYIGGKEISTAYSELVDPVEQRARLMSQSLLGAAGDPEAMQLDEDFLRALETGMPPTGGMGMGIDRLVMMLTGLRSIREVVLFPLVRPE